MVGVKELFFIARNTSRNEYVVVDHWSSMYGKEVLVNWFVTPRRTSSVRVTVKFFDGSGQGAGENTDMDIMKNWQEHPGQ